MAKFHCKDRILQTLLSAPFAMRFQTLVIFFNVAMAVLNVNPASRDWQYALSVGSNLVQGENYFVEKLS